MAGFTRSPNFPTTPGAFDTRHDSAQEAFITGSTRELSPVVRIDDGVIGNGKPGAITLRLLEAFRRRAHALTADTAARR